MSLNYHSLGKNYLDNTALPALLEQLEGFIQLPYDDGKHIATIGIGINLKVRQRDQVELFPKAKKKSVGHDALKGGIGNDMLCCGADDVFGTAAQNSIAFYLQSYHPNPLIQQRELFCKIYRQQYKTVNKDNIQGIVEEIS